MTTAGAVKTIRTLLRNTVTQARVNARACVYALCMTPSDFNQTGSKKFKELKERSAKFRFK